MYQFTEDCLIGIEEIDNEHRTLFQMINEAFELLSDRSNAPMVLKNLLPRLKEYAATHFAHEEAYMEKINDPELYRQKKEHASFTEKIHSYDLGSVTEEHAFSTAEEILTFLVRWLYTHILGSDTMIGKMTAPEADNFAFTEKYKVGIELIDNEHRRLFEIIADVDKLIHEELLHDKYDEIMRLLGELKDYTEFHFEDEEALMERIHYPKLDIQRRAHSAFIERLVGIHVSELDDMDDNQQEYLLELMAYLQNWLIQHILKADKLIGEYQREIDG